MVAEELTVSLSFASELESSSVTGSMGHIKVPHDAGTFDIRLRL
jgi:hypothetical protein